MKKMTIKQILKLLDLNSDINYEIKGTYNGKIYHRSWTNKKEHLERFYNETVPDAPLYVSFRVARVYTAVPVLGIWMNDYDLYHKTI